MDWRQFIASIVSSLAWPAVIAFFLWLIRGRLGSLLSRMVELHLPGGAKAVFAQELDKGRDAIEALTDETVDKVKFWASETQDDSVEEDVPQWLILESYSELEAVLTKAKEVLGLPNRTTFSVIVNTLVTRRVLDSEAAVLFEALRRARNVVIHASSKEVTDAEAMEFARQAELLQDLIKSAIKKLILPKYGQ